MDKIEELISVIDTHEKRETKNFFIRYLKLWHWFLVFSIIGVVLGFLYYKNSPSIFEVKSRILVKTEDRTLANLLSFDNPRINAGGNTNIESQLGVLKSYTLFNEAINNLNWETSWYKKELLYKRELYNSNIFELQVPQDALNVKNVFIEITALNNKQYQLEANGETYQNGYQQEFNIKEVIEFGTPFANDYFNFILKYKNAVIGDVYYLKFNSLQALTNQYLRKTNIVQENINSDIISISIQSDNIRKEVDFINELNNVFINFGVNNKTQNSDNSLKFIDSQLERIQGSLSTAQNNYSNYRKNNQVMNLGQEAQVVYSKLEEIDNEKYLTELQINYYKELQQYLDDSKKIEEMINPSVVGINDPNLNSMLTKLMDLYSRREVLRLSVQDNNPSLIAIDKEIKLTRDGLNETLKNQLKTNESKLESVNQRYNEIQSRLRRLPETERQLVGIQREFDLNNELYTYMMQKKAEASIEKASIVPEVQVMDPARPEAFTYIGPNLMIYVFGGLVGGFSLPFIFITLIGFFNNKIETREEVELHSKIPVLEGIIDHKYKEILPVVHHPRSGIAESFRGLKSNLKALMDNKPGTIVISINSLIPGEGKSFVSSNFASILAKTNKKVLLIGADLHKPTLHKYLDTKETFGLSNYFKNEKSIDDIILATFIPNLFFIQAGPIPDNPSELLDSTKFEHLVDATRNMFDYIIIDNAPILLVPDSVLANNFSDVSVFLLRLNYSHKDQIRQIDKIVDFNKIDNAVLVVNGTPDRGYGYGKKYWKNGYGEYKQ